MILYPAQLFDSLYCSYVSSNYSRAMSFLIPVAVMPALTCALNSIPSEIPSKYAKVSEYLKGYISKYPGTLNSSTIQVRAVQVVKRFSYQWPDSSSH